LKIFSRDLFQKLSTGDPGVFLGSPPPPFLINNSHDSKRYPEKVMNLTLPPKKKNPGFATETILQITKNWRLLKIRFSDPLCDRFFIVLFFFKSVKGGVLNYIIIYYQIDVTCPQVYAKNFILFNITEFWKYEEKNFTRFKE